MPLIVLRCISIQTGEFIRIKKEINLQRILLGFCGFIFHLMVGVIVSYTEGDKGLPLNGYTSTASHFTENAENLAPQSPTIYDLQDRSIGDFSMRKSK